VITPDGVKDGNATVAPGSSATTAPPSVATTEYVLGPASGLGSSAVEVVASTAPTTVPLRRNSNPSYSPLGAGHDTVTPWGRWTPGGSVDSVTLTATT
jgi:hypothetical protein